MNADMHKAPSVARKALARKALTSTDDATPVARYDLSTSEGGRRYIADFFATELRRHDFAGYINTHLAADFACALAQHLAATGKQQVGEVQGAVPAQFEAWAVSIGAPTDKDEHGNYLSSALNYSKLGWDAALAARQPVGEVIEYQSYHGYGGGKWSTCDKKLYDHGKAFEAKYGSGQMSLYRALVVGDAAPPAQGIDLGRQPTPMGWSDTDFLALGNPIPLRIFRKAVMRFKVMAELGVDVESMPMHFMKSPEKYAADVVEANRLLALIDGQRDAAPGVGNG